MSRLIIKNLPKNITEDKIREIFCEKGTVTDIQLKYTKDGKFRQFGFVGYQNEEDAERAIEAFHHMFINTSRITLEKCALLGDSNKPKAWSKYARDSNANKKAKSIDVKEEKPKKKKKVKDDETVELLKKYKDDPLFEEFLQVHAPVETEKLQNIQKDKRDKQEAENEDSAIDSGQESSEEGEEWDEHKSGKLADQEISDMEYMKNLMSKSCDKEENKQKPRKKTEKKIREKIELFTVKLRDLPYNCKKKNIKEFFKPNTPFSIRIPRNIHGIAYVGFKAEKNLKKALMKDRSFINGKQISVMVYKKGFNETGSTSQNDNDPKRSNWKNQEEALKNEEDIAESGKLFIRNLSYTTTEEDIENLFKKYGPLAEVNLPIDSMTRKMKGFGVITFLMPEHAVKAYSELDGSILHGRMLHLLPGKNIEASKTNESIEESSNYKLKKAAKQKAQSGSSHNWNALFLGHDAVAGVIADTYGTSKENVLDPHGQGSAAVRLALGETQIVTQTRKYLEKEGVILDAFNTPTTKKSKTVILVKNLPSRTEPKEIRMVFEKHGLLGRVILPPSGITAIVEYIEPSEARKAFSRLAYSKFKNAPLYLEWAPENSLSANTNDKKEQIIEKPKVHDNGSVQKVEEETKSETKAESDEEEPEPDTTLFVKNLNFKTTDQALRKHFECCGKINYANVAYKKDKSNSDNKLSMGYGFVRYMHKASANIALKDLQQSVLDGKSLELKRSERAFKDEVKSERKTTKTIKQTGTKILVRNVPFQANKKEISELFSTFGEIKALRLPKKIAAGSDSHRGFAFVDFISASDAKTAFEALSQSTHLYGRRLVLEWAAAEEGVDDLRKRTAEHFKKPEQVKKSKKSVFNLD